MTDRPDTLLLDRPRADVALVTFNRAHARNAVDRSVRERMAEIVDKLEADADVRAVILTGSGNLSFSAGADLKAVAQGGLPELFCADKGFAGFVDAPRRKPWIAAVNGFALAGGCEIALACDLIVAADHASFGLPEVARGLIAAAGGAYRLPQMLPRNVANDLLATGRRMDAAEALRWGLVRTVVAPDRLIDTALDLAAEIGANAPLAVAESLAIVRAAVSSDSEALRRASAEALARLMRTEDFAEGPRAFVEKRAPRWQGR